MIRYFIAGDWDEAAEGAAEEKVDVVSLEERRETKGEESTQREERVGGSTRRTQAEGRGRGDILGGQRGTRWTALPG